MQHVVTLSNGGKLLLIERDNKLAITTGTPWDDVDMFICEISPGGIFVMPNSGDAVGVVEGLRESRSPE